MKTKSAKRARARRVSMPGGKSVPIAIDKRGRPATEDARKPALEARQRHTGIADPKEALEAILSTDLGRCVHYLTKGEERANLANTWEAISAARRNYKSRIGGCTGEPKCATIEMIPDRMETDPSLRVDMRTPDEKDSAARVSWEGWAAKIKALPTPLHKWAIQGALNGFMGEGALWRDCAPTDTGLVAVDALRKIAEK